MQWLLLWLFFIETTLACDFELVPHSKPTIRFKAFDIFNLDLDNCKSVCMEDTYCVGLGIQGSTCELFYHPVNHFEDNASYNFYHLHCRRDLTITKDWSPIELFLFEILMHACIFFAAIVLGFCAHGCIIDTCS